jgi:L-2,4-diaminobutyrate decarboxylase
MEQLAAAFIARSAMLGNPGFFAHMDPPTPWITWATSLWAAALNQNLLHSETAPAAIKLEALAIDWLAPFFGMQGGHLVPGSSIANLTALWAAREIKQVREVVTSDAAHLSIRKAAAILGLGFRSIPVDDQQRINVHALGDLRQAALVLTAGTVASGAIDPLALRIDAAWLHVDAAWGGALRLSTRHAHLLDGIQAADSVAISAHKLLFQPKECAAVLFADVERAHNAISFGGSYLTRPTVGVLGSRSARAVPLLATLLAWGHQGMAQRIDRCMELASELAELVKGTAELALFGAPVTGVVLWRPRRSDPELIQKRLKSAFVSLTAVGGQRWFRSVAANPSANPRLVVQEVLSVVNNE